MANWDSNPQPTDTDDPNEGWQWKTMLGVFGYAALVWFLWHGNEIGAWIDSIGGK